MGVVFPSRRYLTFDELISRWSCEEIEIRAAIVSRQLVPSMFVDSDQMPGEWMARSTEEGYEQYLEHIGNERLPAGFLYLRMPFEDGPHSCTFSFVCDLAQGPLEGMDAGWWLSIPRVSLQEVEQLGVFMLAEIQRFETAHGGVASVSASVASRWPWGKHTTTNLEHLAAAAATWWERYSPDDNTTAPTNEAVARWLIEKRGVSKRLAEAIASILRPDNLPTGPRTESPTPRNR